MNFDENISINDTSKENVSPDLNRSVPPEDQLDARTFVKNALKSINLDFDDNGVSPETFMTITKLVKEVRLPVKKRKLSQLSI